MGIRIIDNTNHGPVLVSSEDAKKTRKAPKAKTVDLTLGDSNGLCVTLASDEHYLAQQRKRTPQ
ncbi:MAG: hypothetical protein HRT82_17160 [Henriciella sp.]|nr:hypothetical protein [Henriciella sp.]